MLSGSERRAPVVGDGHRLSWYAMALNISALSIPIHPVSSQVLRWVVIPWMMYLESVIIFIGVIGLMVCRVTSTAASSPIWLDCLSPGTLIALFTGLSSLTQIPLPQVALYFPLSLHDPSVYTVMGSVSAPLPVVGVRRRYVGIWISCSGSTKMRKHSDIWFFVVMEGSKSISPSRCVLNLEFFSSRQ